MNASESELRARNLRLVAVLAGLFLVPLALAFLVYYGTDWRPVGRVNHSELITPARPLPSTDLKAVLASETPGAVLFHKKWTLVYIGSGQCDSDCRRSLYVMRQIRLSLNADMKRVERVLLVTSDCCAREFLAREHPGLLVRDATGPSANGLLELFPTERRAQSVFVVDPLGNLMMRYDLRQNPEGLRDDLKKLLALSHIG